MRVVAGKLKGRKIKSVPSQGTRPILERVRTALFDSLGAYLEEAVVLDAFAGTGGLGIEALSRGAAHCTFLDIGKEAVATLKANVRDLELGQQATVRKTDAFAFVRHTEQKFSLIFIAPPQYQGLWIEMLQALAERPEIVAPQGLVVIQIDPKEFNAADLPRMSAFSLKKEKKYGNTLILILQKQQ